MNLIEHPFLKGMDPSQSRLVRRSQPFPQWLNPFWKDGVVIYALGIPGEIQHIKVHVGFELMVEGIRNGLITSETVIVEASSGNTGRAIAEICKALGLMVRIIVPAGTVGGKLDAIRVIGSGLEVILHTDPNETPVERARREGAQKGWYNPGQYDNLANPRAQQKYLAPQLFEAARGLSILAVASGTMGTCMGLKQYVIEHGLSTRILPVILEEEEEVPGCRPLSKIEKDIRLPWKKLFSSLEDIEYGRRHAAFLLSHYSWRWVPQMFGPSFGLAFQGLIRRLSKEKEAGTLDRYRDENEKVQAGIVGADGHLNYLGLIMGETLSDERHSYAKPDLLEIAFEKR